MEADEEVRVGKRKRVGRPRGSKSGYKMSESAKVQRVAACVKSLEARKVKTAGDVDVLTSDERKGRVHKKVVDGTTRLRSMQKLLGDVPELRDLSEDELKEHPLFHVYKNTLLDVTQSPLKYLAKTAARLEIAMARQSEKDVESGVAIGKEMLEATKVALKAVDISVKANKEVSKKGRRVMSSYRS